MHMADALISAPIGLTMMGATALALGYAIKKVEKEDNGSKSVKMGILGAMVFAAQMVNFTIPGTGASGHIIGTILLAALLGPFAGFITIASIILVQALVFADGGLLAYGCNVFNMGFYSAFIAYPLIMQPLLKKEINTKRIMGASLLSCIVGVILGAISVIAETYISGVSSLSLTSFILLLVPIHIVIGAVEGLITGLVLGYLYEAKPSLLVINEKEEEMSKKSIMVLGSLTILTATVLSLFASKNPDGLEWSLAKDEVTRTKAISSVAHFFSQIQSHLSLLPDYSMKGIQGGVGTAISGFIGIVTVVLLSLLIKKLIAKKEQHVN